MNRFSRSQSLNDSEEVLDKVDKVEHEALALDGTDKVDFRLEETEEDEGVCDYGVSGPGERKRRLRVDQVKALEIDFLVEKKLDPERKQRLAQDLGLQPRQVAVWFQNRRARRKTKQLEHDFVALRTRFDALTLDCDALRSDNEALQSLIRELEAELRSRSKTGEEETPHLIYKAGSPESDSSVVFNGEVPLQEHCLTECWIQTEETSGHDEGGCLDEELVGGEDLSRSCFKDQPAQNLYLYCSDDWD